MSFDPFETRLQFLQLLKKLNASQPSIQKVVAFALRYGSRCGEDLWECIAEECGKGSLNTRINIFYLLDSLAEASLGVGPSDAPYVRCMARDLGCVVESVVPPTKEGVLNLKAVKQILDSWRTRRILDPSVIDPVVEHLENRSIDLSSPKKRDHSEAFSRADILRRMEEDRERHKRLRERMWILPVPPLTQQPNASASATAKPRHGLGANATVSPLSTSPFTPASPSTAGQQPASHRTAAMSTGTKGGTMAPPPVPHSQPQEKDWDRSSAAPPTGDTALDVEFEQMWEAAVPLESEDFQRMRDDAKQAGIRIPI